jgi:hypothetical protein
LGAGAAQADPPRILPLESGGYPIGRASVARKIKAAVRFLASDRTLVLRLVRFSLPDAKVRT